MAWWDSTIRRSEVQLQATKATAGDFLNGDVDFGEPEGRGGQPRRAFASGSQPVR